MKLEVFIHYEYNSSEKKFDYTVHTSDFGWLGETLIETQELEFESPPEAEMRRIAYASLQAKRQKVLADAQVKANELDAQAHELLALENHMKRADDDIPF